MRGENKWENKRLPGQPSTFLPCALLAAGAMRATRFAKGAGRKVKEVHILKDLLERAIKASATFLEGRGYEILDRNWSNGGSTIDIVARDEDGVIVVVDVKARVGADKGFPVDTEASRERLESAAAQWLAAHDDEELIDVSVRFDAISMMVIDDSRAFLRHHINRFGTADAVA